MTTSTLRCSVFFFVPVGGNFFQLQKFLYPPAACPFSVLLHLHQPFLLLFLELYCIRWNLTREDGRLLIKDLQLRSPTACAAPCRTTSSPHCCSNDARIPPSQRFYPCSSRCFSARPGVGAHCRCCRCSSISPPCCYNRIPWTRDSNDVYPPPCWLRNSTSVPRQVASRNSWKMAQLQPSSAWRIDWTGIERWNVGLHQSWRRDYYGGSSLSSQATKYHRRVCIWATRRRQTLPSLRIPWWDILWSFAKYIVVPRNNARKHWCIPIWWRLYSPPP